MTRADLQELAKLRLKEAQLLLANNCPSGAYYLVGYAVECALKACIARATLPESFPDKQRVNQAHTHDLEALMRVAGLNKALEAALQHDILLATSWDIVRKWSEASRYDRWNEQDAAALMNAVDDQNGGVLTWLAQHW